MPRPLLAVLLILLVASCAAPATTAPPASAQLKLGMSFAEASQAAGPPAETADVRASSGWLRTSYWRNADGTVTNAIFDCDHLSALSVAASPQPSPSAGASTSACVSPSPSSTGQGAAEVVNATVSQPPPTSSTPSAALGALLASPTASPAVEAPVPTATPYLTNSNPAAVSVPAPAINNGGCGPGQHYVSGYTRKNGTHVNGYCRS